jgi:hypothetical protein
MFDPDKNLPACMIPDGGECCEAYAKLYAAWKALHTPSPAALDPVTVEALKACREFLEGMNKQVTVGGPFIGVISSQSPTYALIEKINRALLTQPAPSGNAQEVDSK